METKITKQSSRVWEWAVTSATGEHLAGGYCRTKRDAESDASIWREAREKTDARETGRAAYEADVSREPVYHDGMPRPTWDKLSDLARWQWNRHARAATTPAALRP